jgi:DtxR family manganese transport transcriptional regulator
MELKPVSRDAERFRRVRAAHRTELAEDYVELIADLIADEGEARVAQLSSRLGVTKATVNNTLSRLARDGLVAVDPYQPVTLTERGREIALASKDRHRIVTAVLIAIGVEADIAEADAEGIEHHVSAATLAAMKRFLASSAERAGGS